MADLSEHEEPLRGGWSGRLVVRVGDTVRRLPHGNAELAHALLLHLEATGFHGAPRFLGMDDRGREILSYLPGETLDADTIFHEVYPAATLHGVGAFLRRFHDHADGCPGAAPDGGPGMVVHGDPGPWNMAWRGSEPIGLFDFDTARPGERIEDIGYAVWKCLALERAPILERDADAHAEGRRAAALVGGYGADALDIGEIVPAAIGEIVRMRDVRLRDLDRTEHAEVFAALDFEIAWFQAQGDVFERGLRAAQRQAEC